MAKLTLNDLTNLNSPAITSINSNNAATEAALENTLSRDGTSPNSMEAALDMNSYSILNGGTGNFTSVKINGVTVVPSSVTTVPVSFEDDEFEVKDNADNTKVLKFELSGLTTATTRTVTWPDVSATVLMSTSASVQDLGFEIYDDGDNTKKLKVDCSGISTATTRTMTVPNASGTWVLEEDATVDKLSVNGQSADSTNLIAAATPAVFFNRSVDDIQLKLNKEATADTGSIVFQTGTSGRAEIGCVGNDNFVFKTSTDGSNFNTGLTFLTADSGVPQLPSLGVDDLPTAAAGNTGAIVYCTDGDTGSACLAVSDGSDWKVVALGSTVSKT